MSFYVKQGNLPHKKHTTFFKEDKKSLYREELVGSKGFSGIYSTLYHFYPPTTVKQIEELTAPPVETWSEAPLSYYHFLTDDLNTQGNAYQGRVPLLTNSDISISVAAPTENSTVFFKNAAGHELIFIHKGFGFCHSEYGTLLLMEGDYLIVPKSTVYQLEFESFRDVRLLILESAAPFEIPSQFRNEFGQLLEHAPYTERDFKVPQLKYANDHAGDQILLIKNGKRLFRYLVPHHPFDVIGWDGYRYPFTFNIKDYAPIVGKIHQPPPVHLVFTTPRFVVCNFVPRLLDFHPEAIPAPYHHSNTDSDEVLYYVSGDFTSRKGIREGSITLHPRGIPHGPHPGKIEASVGQKETAEYAVMIDTLSPLELTVSAQHSMVEDYCRSWL